MISIKVWRLDATEDNPDFMGIILMVNFLPAFSADRPLRQKCMEVVNVSMSTPCATPADFTTTAAAAKLLHSRVTDAYYVWLIGATGAGKTTLARLLTGDKRVKGTAGFRHGTSEITEHQFLDFDDPNFVSIRLMDTRGYADMEYTVDDFARDIYTHPRYYRSKMLMVIKEERLYHHTIEMIKAASAVSGGEFTTVLTRCSQQGILEFRSVLKERGVAHGKVLCYHLYESNEADVWAQIMTAVRSDKFLEIERLHKASMITRSATALDKVLWKYLGKLLKHAAGVGICRTTLSYFLCDHKPICMCN